MVSEEASSLVPVTESSCWQHYADCSNNGLALDMFSGQLKDTKIDTDIKDCF